MNVIRASVLGYCAGVRRAVDAALREADNLEKEKGGKRKIFTFGPLIHNAITLAELEARGIAVFDGTGGAGDCVIIRAHGVAPSIEADLAERGFRVIDATCPKVKKSQLNAQKLYETGYRVFLAGEKTHAEIQGIQGHAPNAILVENAEQASAEARALFNENPIAATALIGQTTSSFDEYRAIAGAIQAFFPKVEILDTICSATLERQNALKQLCALADAIIIAGGKNSANTRRLLDIAEKTRKPAVLVESADDIPEAFFHYEIIGVSAGASTPDKLIDEIEFFLKTHNKAVLP
jgi:4-hydroxy-3-methylbut-2-enyl diphosphate reductase